MIGALSPGRSRVAAVSLLLGALLAGCGPGASGAGSGAPSGPGTGSVAASTAASAGLTAQSAGSCPAPSPNAPGAAESRLPVRSLCALPPEAATEWRSIATGAPQRYSQDGATFGNFERRLPQHQRGYYHEYTIPTPGSRDRGARRFITGGGRELYYTADHYGSFVVVDPDAVGR
jgi:guanyl-specific ribonuclease Sa